MTKKKILIITVFLIALILGASWTIGTYFIDFALKRGTDANPKTIPAATRSIISATEKEDPMPSYDNEEWVIQATPKEKRVATALYANQHSHKWVIIAHGYGRNRHYAWRYATHYLDRGYNVLTPDLNASGDSDGRYLTMGKIESQDLRKWVDEVLKKDPNARIILHGISMGAATVCMTTGIEGLPPQVIAAIEDCGYTSAYDMFTLKLRELFDLPEFPVMHIVNATSKIKLDYDMVQETPLNAVTKTKIPMLFIHGTADKLIAPSHMDRLFEASAAPIKEKFLVEGAGHADAMRKDPMKYYAKIDEFLEKIEF